MRRRKVTIDGRVLSADEKRVVLNALDAYSTLLQGNFSQLSQYFLPFGAYDRKKVGIITEAFHKASHEMVQAQTAVFGGSSKCLALRSAPHHALIGEILRHEIDGEDAEVEALKDLDRKRSVWDDTDVIGPDDDPA